ncbi:aminotransferase class IV [Verrucomicrobiales bacterium]|nr:aminotransferase class IV [Verrucomicrobiales bacterium]
MAEVWINGDFVPESEASIPISDRGFQVGHGVFETFLALAGKPVFLQEHLARLAKACAMAQLDPPASEVLANAVDGVLASHSSTRLRVRIQVTPQTTLVSAASAPEPEGMLDVVTVPWPRNERAALAGVKAVSYAENILALDYARRHGAREALFGNTQGNLCEGATTNVFAVFEGSLWTPPVESGCLPGVMRAAVLRIAGDRGIDVQIEDIPMKYLSDRAEEMFLTSSLRIVQPVARIDGKAVDHAPGRMALVFSEASRVQISAEIS